MTATNKTRKNLALRELEKFPRKVVPCDEGQTKEETGRNVAALAISPAMAALRVVNAVDGAAMADSLDIPTLHDTLRDQGAAVNRGDLSQVEAMLINQATALQSLFARLAERAMGNENIAPFDANMKMALRAQSQCRATLETLASIKNPPVVYARQANVTTGPQQINNGIPANSQAREIQNAQTQLSGEHHELLPNARASSLARGANQEMEAVGKSDRPQNPRR